MTLNILARMGTWVIVISHRSRVSINWCYGPMRRTGYDTGHGHDIACIRHDCYSKYLRRMSEASAKERHSDSLSRARVSHHNLLPPPLSSCDYSIVARMSWVWTWLWIRTNSSLMRAFDIGLNMDNWGLMKQVSQGLIRCGYLPWFQLSTTIWKTLLKA